MQCAAPWVGHSPSQIDGVSASGSRSGHTPLETASRLPWRRPERSLARAYLSPDRVQRRRRQGRKRDKDRTEATQSHRQHWRGESDAWDILQNRSTGSISGRWGGEDLREDPSAPYAQLKTTHVSRLALLSTRMADLYARMIAAIGTVNDPWLEAGVSPESREPAESSCIFFSKIRIRAISFPTCLIGSRAARGGDRQAERRPVRGALGRAAPLELAQPIESSISWPRN